MLELEGVHFLLVEDHPFQLEMLQQALLSLGATAVRTASNGAEAVRVLREPGAVIDIVISDVRMPEVDGLELLPMLARLAPRASLILTSVEDWTLEVGQTLAKGNHVPMLGTVKKPLTPAKLKPLLEAYLAERSRR